MLAEQEVEVAWAGEWTAAPSRSPLEHQGLPHHVCLMASTWEPSRHLFDKGDYTCTFPVSRWGRGLSPEYEARVLQDTLPLCSCACYALGSGGRGLEPSLLQAWYPLLMPYASYLVGTLAWPGTHFGVEGLWLQTALAGFLPPCARPVEVRLYCPIPSPAVSPLPAGAAANQELCIDQAVVFIEDAIKVCGGHPADLESALSLCSLLSWGGCLEFWIDTMAGVWSQLSSYPLMEAIFLVLES